MPKYLQVRRYLVQDFSVVDFWTVVLESYHATLEDAAMRDGTCIYTKKTVAWETTISVDKKRGVLKLKFQAVQSEYKVLFFSFNWLPVFLKIF